MTFSRSIASIVFSATVATAGLATLSTAADAGEWRHDGYGRHDRGLGYHGRDEWRREGRWHDGRRYDHGGRNFALGAAAAVIGLGIAAEASRDYRYDEGY